MLGRSYRHFALIPRALWTAGIPLRPSHFLVTPAAPNQATKWATAPQTQLRLLATQSTGESGTPAESLLDNALYDRVCGETLDALSDYFDELTEGAAHLHGSDVAYGDGVLTIKLGAAYGTYVINRQTPNKQIWLSSPTSGPKRYDFVGPKTGESGKWVYKHDGESLHALLQREIGLIITAQRVDFLQLPYSS